MKGFICPYYSFLFACFLWPLSTYGQDIPPLYYSHIQAADSLSTSGLYLPAAYEYSAAFASFNWKGRVSDRYNAARAWACGEMSDSAFFQLGKIVNKGQFEDLDTLQHDPAFVSLRSDTRWATVLQAVRKNQGINDTFFNAALYQLLDSLEKEDQKWRHRSTDLQNAPVVDTAQVSYACRMYCRTDSLNYYLLRSIIHTYGFPDYDLVGKAGTHNFWLLVQHQDRHPDFQESVLQLMEKEVAVHKAAPQDYAYLLDRVMKNTGRPQVYGTQMVLNQAGTSYEPAVVTDPDHLNERRKSMGLGSIEAYIGTMNQHYRGTLKKQ